MSPIVIMFLSFALSTTLASTSKLTVKSITVSLLIKKVGLASILSFRFDVYFVSLTNVLARVNALLLVVMLLPSI